MSKKIKYLTFFLLIILLAGCSGGYDEEDETVLETAEAEEETEDFKPF